MPTCDEPRPSSWLIDNLDLLPRRGRVLDVASGRGRHALHLAAAGFRVHAIDRDRTAIEALAATARVRNLPLTCEVIDLETDPPPDLGDGGYAAVVVFNYLHRPLFPSLRRAVAPGGVLVYETFTLAQAARGRPRNPAFLLRLGELADLVSPLAVRRSFEGERDNQSVSAVVAERSRPR